MHPRVFITVLYVLCVLTFSVDLQKSVPLMSQATLLCFSFTDLDFDKIWQYFIIFKVM